jgi:hypothetical protein
VHRRGVVLGPTHAVVFPLPIAIILLVLLMWSDVYAMEGRYASLDMLHAEPDLSATLLANLKAYSRWGDRSVGECLEDGYRLAGQA